MISSASRSSCARDLLAVRLRPGLPGVLEEGLQVLLHVLGLDALDLLGEAGLQRPDELLEIEPHAGLDGVGLRADLGVVRAEVCARTVELRVHLADAHLELLELQAERSALDAEVLTQVTERAQAVADAVVEQHLTSRGRRDKRRGDRGAAASPRSRAPPDRARADAWPRAGRSSDRARPSTRCSRANLRVSSRSSGASRSILPMTKIILSRERRKMRCSRNARSDCLQHLRTVEQKQDRVRARDVAVGDLGALLVDVVHAGRVDERDAIAQGSPPARRPPRTSPARPPCPRW